MTSTRNAGPATEDVHVDEWGVTVRVRGLPRDRLAQLARSPAGLFAAVAADCVVDEDGEPLFTAADLGGKSSKALERIYRVVARLSGGLPEPPSVDGPAVLWAERAGRFREAARMRPVRANALASSSVRRPSARARSPRRAPRRTRRSTRGPSSRDEDPSESDLTAGARP